VALEVANSKESVAALALEVPWALRVSYV